MRTCRPIATATAAVLLVLFAACGGDDDDAGTIDAAADQEVIDDATITVDDLPDGFEAQDPSDEEDDDTDDADDCFAEVGADPDALDEAKVVEGEDSEFQLVTDEALVGITVSINSFDGSDAPLENLEAVGDDDFLDCAVESIERSSGDEGQEIGDVSAEGIDSPIDADDAASVRIEFETQGFPTIIEQHLVLVGRFGIALQILTVNEEPDEDLVADLLDTMIDRIEAGSD
jgi:hypothetical protein